MSFLQHLQKNINTNSDYILIGFLIFILIILFYRTGRANNIDNTTNAHIVAEKYQNDLSNDSAKLVLYYTDWCGFSQQFLPVWAEVKKVLGSKYSALNILEFECSKDDGKCNNVKGYPTVRFEKNGHIEEFMGPRTVQGLDDFVKGRI